MSQEPQQIERDDALSIYEADPVLGKYVSHHPSNRLRLVIIGGILYGVPVLIIQLIFFQQVQFAEDGNPTIDILLPVIFAAIAGAVLWWMLHLWNREVVLYERGLSYRQGSMTAYILYANVSKLIQNIERIGFLGLSRTVYDYRLRTEADEDLIINNVYSNPKKLTRSLEAFIARDRLPIMRYKLSEGLEIRFGDDLRITQEGIILRDNHLAWHALKGQRVKDGQMIFQSVDNDAWGILPVAEIDNPVLLIALLRDRGQSPQVTA